MKLSGIKFQPDVRAKLWPLGPTAGRDVSWNNVCQMWLSREGLPVYQEWGGELDS